MLGRVYELASKWLTLAKDVQQCQDDIKDLRQEVRVLSQEVRVLAIAVHRLSSELQHLRENERHEREKLALRLENEWLRQRQLPGGKPSDEEQER